MAGSQRKLCETTNLFSVSCYNYIGIEWHTNCITKKNHTVGMFLMNTGEKCGFIGWVIIVLFIFLVHVFLFRSIYFFFFFNRKEKFLYNFVCFPV